MHLATSPSQLLCAMRKPEFGSVPIKNEKLASGQVSFWQDSTTLCSIGSTCANANSRILLSAPANVIHRNSLGAEWTGRPLTLLHVSGRLTSRTEVQLRSREGSNPAAALVLPYPARRPAASVSSGGRYIRPIPLPRHHCLLRARLGCGAPHQDHPSPRSHPFWSAPSLDRER
jgi:hypothetical protein